MPKLSLYRDSIKSDIGKQAINLIGKRQYDKAYDMVTSQMKDHHAESTYLQAWFTLNGLGTEKNPEKAMKIVDQYMTRWVKRRELIMLQEMRSIKIQCLIVQGKHKEAQIESLKQSAS